MASSSASVTAVPSSATTGLLLAANTSRYGGNAGASVVIANDSTAVLYILLGTGTASSSNYSYSLAGNGGGVAGTLTISGYRGPIQGVWASANGQALVSEML